LADVEREPQATFEERLVGFVLASCGGVGVAIGIVNAKAHPLELALGAGVTILGLATVAWSRAPTEGDRGNISP
jgi:hypothetical protein